MLNCWRKSELECFWSNLWRINLSIQLHPRWNIGLSKPISISTEKKQLSGSFESGVVGQKVHQESQIWMQNMLFCRSSSVLICTKTLKRMILRKYCRFIHIANIISISIMRLIYGAISPNPRDFLSWLELNFFCDEQN